MTTTPLHTEQDTLHTLLFYIRETVAILWKDWPKNMEAVFLDHQKFSLCGDCPHCKRSTVFFPVNQGYQEQHSQVSNQAVYRIVEVAQCQGCKKFILASAIKPSQQATFNYEMHYPLGSPNEVTEPSIPADVGEDFNEAIRCQFAKSYRACVVMCRRALQTSALAFRAQGKNLVEQIEDLSAKGIITSSLKEFAHEIRLTGNAGAHSDGLQGVNESDADAIMEFTRLYLENVYVMPAKLRARRPQPQAPTSDAATGNS